MTDNEWFKRYLQNIERQVEDIKDCIEKLPDLLEKKYITRQEFTPVRLIVYGIAGISLTALLITLLREILLK